MNTITLKKAKEDLVNLIDQVISDSEPTIICGEEDKKAVLMSLDEFNSWQETLTCFLIRRTLNIYENPLQKPNPGNWSKKN